MPIGNQPEPVSHPNLDDCREINTAPTSVSPSPSPRLPRLLQRPLIRPVELPLDLGPPARELTHIA